MFFITSVISFHTLTDYRYLSTHIYISHIWHGECGFNDQLYHVTYSKSRHLLRKAWLATTNVQSFLPEQGNKITRKLLKSKHDHIRKRRSRKQWFHKD